MGKDSVVSLPSRGIDGDPLTELIRTGARQLIQRALEAELLSFMNQFEDRVLCDGRAAVVRNGYQLSVRYRPA